MTGPSNGDDPPARPTDWDPGRRPANSAPRTDVDPGRGGTPVGAAPLTSVDPGRSGRRERRAPLTSVDPGRSQPLADGSSFRSDRSSGPGLPPTLAARFELLRELGRGAQADVHVVREKATDATWVLKVYDEVWEPDEQVWAYLRSGRRSPAVVETVETDRVDGCCYELMEYLPGSDLMTLRRGRTLEELGADQLKAIVTQLVDALDDIHDNGLVHRDLKPTNVVIRTLVPIEIAVVDFGISTPSDQEVNDRNGTPPYTPPQFLMTGSVDPADDFWALGISLIEFFTGTRVLGDLDDQVALKHRLLSPIYTAAVTDERLRLLCDGLTVVDQPSRWGSRQVREWLAGGSPPVPGYRASSPEERSGGAAEPYRFSGVDHRFPDELAAAMTDAWREAASLLFGADPSEVKRLREWLRQFPDVRWPERWFGPREPADVRLLRVLRAMGPKAPPIHRSYPVWASRLPELAQQAYDGIGNAATVVAELAAHDLLPLLATAPAAADRPGGEGLEAIAADWAATRAWWARARADLPDDARAYLDRLERTDPVQPLAVALRAVTATAETRASANGDVQRAARRARRFASELGWFVDLADRADTLWSAFLLIPFVTGRIDGIAREAAAARRRREWLRRSQAVREWSRRQNRPQALAWSVAGVACLAAVMSFLIALSDAAGVSADQMIVAAWLVTVFGLAVVLAGEALLAWEVGGEFHPRYSLLGAGRVQLSRAARSALARSRALIVVLGVVGGLVVVSVFLPVLVPVALTVVVPLWAWRRFLGWEDDRVREQGEIEQAERDRRQRLSRAREGVG